jgi:dTDP-4-dehydrorhamnose 3,5-epimerase
MQFEPLHIPGPLLVRPAKFEDARGFFSETYNARLFREAGLPTDFVQDNHSLSAAAGVVRGLHFQLPPRAQGKLVRVVRGAVLDVAVDLRRGSPSFGQYVAVELSAANWRQLWIPVGFAHGFCTLEPDTEVIYKVTDFYDAASERGLAWDDPDLAIPWPVAPADAVLSDKDRRQPRLAALPDCFGFEA